MKSLRKIIDGFLAKFPSRQRDIIEQRFGLAGKKLTLAAIGKKYNLTRERIRQIEAGGLELVRNDFGKGPAKKIWETALADLKKHGGVRKEDEFIDDLKTLLKDNTINRQNLQFIFEIFREPYYYKNNKDFYNFYHLNRESLKKAVDFLNKLEKIAKSKKEELLKSKKFEFLSSEIAKSLNLDSSAAKNYLFISKKFKINPYGDFGPSQWEEINPKTIGSKSYLIIKRHGQPLHFKEIAQKINKTKFDSRIALEATVHNELIKDPRFVLVGRGIYSLAEFGHQPGTAKEVIGRILKGKGPMPAKDIINLVKQERFLKENTILLNLQNKKYFKKLPDGKYHLA
ncbi:hypothetical protein A2999_01760 [Candidatus Wolfebacteria bacterium RIFCSPLOWO2_01_FULL_38_11]|uniref:Sigma-70 region 4 domain protein n=2 Tax=Candidatus Wolfeibacteriota TaxID=1752735 RepID=A0A0G0IFT1_9BACT|nr:MAG: sigma-70 region 4 domain protein [Candidatus Wolfebacteria bacterium GW2011_GWC1_37_10]OGM90671.1 MAG: hypothetical protein A2999_01760 [Candidatus Wolfebacteria bacterium RIFCSPLOWO2_01_FULL_38_11]